MKRGLTTALTVVCLLATFASRAQSVGAGGTNDTITELCLHRANSPLLSFALDENLSVAFVGDSVFVAHGADQAHFHAGEITKYTYRKRVAVTSADSTVCAGSLPLTWNGVTFTAPGTQSAVLAAACGADSTVVMTLTVLPADTTEITEVACESFMWYGTTLTASGDYTRTITNAAGCDSVVTLHLTVNQPTTGDTTAVACGSFTWYGTTLTASDDYTRTITNAAGCDSVVTLHLTVNETSYTEIHDTILASELPYTFSGIVYNGAVQDDLFHFTNAAGCDSTLSFSLYIINDDAVDDFATTPWLFRFDGRRMTVESYGTDLDVVLYSVSGQILRRERINANANLNYSLETYADGIYLVRINNKTYKIVKR